MKSKKFQNVLENAPLLNQFAQKVWFEQQTPSIIRLVSSNADYMKLCAAIVNDADSDAILPFACVCREQGIDIRLVREKLIPVANALGLTIESATSQDYYNILGLTSAASADEIKKSFRQKARTVHPDTNHSGKSQSRAFVELHEAYQTLSNPESRRHYDQKGPSSLGQWNEQRPQSQKMPRKSGYIYMIGGLALFFVTAAFIFDFIFREEVLSDLPYTEKQPPVYATKLSENELQSLAYNRSSKTTKISKPQVPTTLNVKKAPLPQYHSDSGKQTVIVNHTAKKPAAPLYHPSVSKNSDVAKLPMSPKMNKAPLPPYHFDSGKQTVIVNHTAKKPAAPLYHPSVAKNSDAAKRPMSPKMNPDDRKRKKKRVLTISPIEYIDTEKNSALLLEKGVSPPVLSLPEKDRVSMELKDKIELFIKTYCMTYEQKKLEKFASFFKADAIENGKLFHALLPQYRHNFAKIASITYTIVMHQYSYLSDSTDIKMEGEFFMRWREYGANWKKNSGSVFMHLEQSGNLFLVKQLYYLAGGNNNTEKPSVNHVSQIGMPELKKKVEKFVNNYCQAYENKNLAKFASFFRPDATENGVPFYTLLPQYRHNFDMIDSMTYNIVIHRYSRLNAKAVKIDGAFSMRWHERSGNQSKNNGSISMVISVEDNSFRMKALNYSSN